MPQDDRYLMSSTEKLFYVVLSSKARSSLYKAEQGCHLWKFCKANDFLFEKLKKLSASYHQKSFVIYVSEWLAFWKVGVATSYFNHLCQQEKVSWMVWSWLFGGSRLRNKMGQNIFGPLKILFLTEIVEDDDKEK
jgi:hypothetical protein